MYKITFETYRININGDVGNIHNGIMDAYSEDLTMDLIHAKLEKQLKSMRLFPKIIKIIKINGIILI